MKPYQVCSFIIFLALLLTTFCYPDELGANYYDSAQQHRLQLLSTQRRANQGADSFNECINSLRAHLREIIIVSLGADLHTGNQHK